ncbi:MAG: hypothetical protein QM811_27130 [Pirellulales bacterium]
MLRRSNVLRQLFATTLVALGSLSSASAADWMFQRSYYTHDPVTPVQVGPQAPPGGPYYSRVQGEFTQSGLRTLRSTIRAGHVVDTYQTWEGWTQRGVQY